MFLKSKRSVIAVAVFLVIAGFFAASAYAKDMKFGYVDLRKAFYEYGRTADMEKDLNELSEKQQAERVKKIEVINKLRDQGEMSQGQAKVQKQKEIEGKLLELQQFDETARIEWLNKKNEMFRDIVDDIQKIVTDIGESRGYDFIFDSRNIMYPNKTYDLTEEVVGKLNK